MGGPCVRESFKNTLRNFTEVVGFIFWLLTLKFKCLVITWCFLLNMITSVQKLFQFRDNLLLRIIHWQRSFKSLSFSCRFAHILIGCIIFLSLFLDLDVVIRLFMIRQQFPSSRLWQEFFACRMLAFFDLWLKWL